MDTNHALLFCERGPFSTRNLFWLVMVLSLVLIMATKAAAQYGGGGGTSGGGTTDRGSSSGTYNAPKGGYRSATGAGIAAGAAAGATALFLALHYHGRVIDYFNWREQNASFSEMGAFTILEGFNLSGDGKARRIQ